jgi:type VI secretion system secreted protein Hcp
VPTDVIITSVIVNGSASSEDRPIEEVSFAYGQINWTYTEYDEGGMPMGNVEAHWDIELDTGG